MQKEKLDEEDRELRLQLIEAFKQYTDPRNLFSEYVSFGEVISLNAGSNAFNDEMQRSGILQLAKVASESVKRRVQALANEIKREYTNQ